MEPVRIRALQQLTAVAGFVSVRWKLAKKTFFLFPKEVCLFIYPFLNTSSDYTPVTGATVWELLFELKMVLQFRFFC